MKKGFTLVELLVIVAILGILVCLVMGALGALGVGVGYGNKTFNAEVIDKWTDLDGNSNKLYRIRTSSQGEIDTWDSYWCHNDLQLGVSYEFQSYGSTIRKANRLAIQPERIPKQNE